MADFVYDYDYYYYHFNPYTVFPYEYRCDGDESSLFECDHIEAFLFRGFCSLGEYAGVICQCKLHIQICVCMHVYILYIKCHLLYIIIYIVYT